MLRSRP